MADRVQAYDQSPVPRATLQSENNKERHLIDHRQPHRAATSPFPSTMSSRVNPYLGQTAYPPPQLYSGQRNPQTTPMSNTYFPQNKKYTYSDPLYPMDEPIPGFSQLYPAHEQRLYSVSYYNHGEVRMPTPEPFVPVPPKPLTLQETRRNGGHAFLHPTLYRTMTSPPVPPKPVLLSESEARPVVISTGAYPRSSWPGLMTSTADEIPRPPGAVATDPPVAEESADQQLQDEDGGDDLAVAMALSKDESEREEERMQELVRLEEEELERALAASMLTANGSYDDFESQLHAEPPDLASSATGSNFFAIPPDVHLETDPSATSSSSLETPAKDATSQAQETDELDHEDSAFQVHEGTKPTPEIVKTSHQTTKRCSFDAPSCPRMSSNDDQVEIYPSAAVSSTSAAPSFPPMIQPRPVIGTNDGDDSDDDGLPYLKGARGSLSVSIPLLTEPERESRLNPVSASFIDLSYDDSYIDEDEAFARRLVEEEISSRKLLGGETAVPRQSDHLNGQEPLECNLSRNSSATSASTRPRPETPNNLPTYSDIMSDNPGPALRGSTFLPSVTVDSPTSPEKAELVQNSSTAGNPIARASSQLVVPFPSNGLSAVALPPDAPQRVRVSSLSALIPGRTLTENELPLSPVDDLATPMNHLPLNSRAGYPPMKGISSSSNNPSCAGVFNPSLFIDAELFLGVSIQFTPPVISARLVPMQGQMPTLISLPYGRCPPLHFQASSWRHILKLMARLSSTRIEPSTEAMAVNKNEALKLRTVIQFIKPHHMTEEWRTILWFTIDHPVPLNIPNAAKHNSTNVNNLPFSYTLSSIPALLKDASDTSLSKTYTIPATSSVPHPSLPITFPNLALYLQAALDDSRKQSESSPLRKLAKMVQTCYPNDFVPQESDEPENSRGVSGLFKRVMGRGGKKKGGGGNEDTYDLVTPFVPDEWG